MGALRVAWILIVIVTMLFIVSCSVISTRVRNDSVTPDHFKTLVSEADRYIGETVILGGYILETKNSADESTLTVLQSPLGFGQEPKSKDHTQGRFIVLHKGFLEPEVYSKDRKITVAGTVLGTVAEKIDGFLHPHVKIRSIEIYLWSKEAYPYHSPYYDRWNCPYFDCWPWYRRHPYFW